MMVMVKPVVLSCLLILAWLPPSLWGRVVIYPNDPHSQILSQPDFVPDDEPVTNLTVDQLIMQSYTDSQMMPPPAAPEDVMFSPPLSPDGTILAELDMRLTPAMYKALYSNDSDTTREKRKATMPERMRWTNGVIPYEFVASDFNANEVYKIKEAMQDWEDHTCLKFRPATNRDKNRIRIQNGGGGCNAILGMSGGTQTVNLFRQGCRFSGLYRHELGHSIGLVHEHQLPDRGNYIRIDFNNVMPGWERWFKPYSRKQVNTYGVKYEYSSVMHYGITAFSKDGRSQTIYALDPKREVEIGKVYWKGLAYSDIKTVNLMYKCNKKCKPDKRCRSPGYLDKNCKCVCPKNTDCGYGLTECADDWTGGQCASWAKKGECNKNPIWMKAHCQKSCGSCPTVKPTKRPVVKPTKSPTVLRTTRSPPRTKSPIARTTPSGSCINKWGDNSCNYWSRTGYCRTRQAWMKTNCNKACGLCTGSGGGGGGKDCRDNNGSCAAWSRVGYCKTNAYTAKNCKKSCGTC